MTTPEELKKLKKLMIRETALRMRIARAKTKLIEDCDYVGIVYIIRSMSPESRDRLFMRYHERHPDDHLFVIAFADEGSGSKTSAEEVADLAYGQEIHEINEDVRKEKDEVLMKFLEVYHEKEDLEYVLELVGDDENLRSYRKAAALLDEFAG